MTATGDGPVAGKGLAVIGVDPGARWTAGVIRVGDAAIWGWTIGPHNEAGEPVPIGDVDDLVQVFAYLDRVVERVEASIDYATKAGYEQIRVAVEAVRMSVGWRSGRRTRIPVGDWLTPRDVMVAVWTAFPAARLVAPDRHGRREAASYPVEMRRSRPKHWPPNEARRGERDHERAAFDLAGVAAGLP